MNPAIAPTIDHRERVIIVSEGRNVATNRKARHDYHVEDRLEAGIVLTGTEVKSVRMGRVNLQDSFARVENGEVFLYNVHISEYTHGNRWNHDPTRRRKLLLNRREIDRLTGRIDRQGYTVIPLRMYFNRRGIAKVEIALAKGKRQWDKRRDLAKRDAERQVEVALKESTRGGY